MRHTNRSSQIAIDRSRYAASFEKFCALFLTHYCQLRVFGNVPTTDKPFLICANHRSHLDSVAIMMALGIPFSSCGLLAAEDYFFRGTHGLRLITRAMHLIPVSGRRRPHLEIEAMIHACASFLQNGGRALLAYPQGTRSRSGTAATFKRGAAVLALRLEIPVLPIFISGTERVLPKQQIIPRPGLITVNVGQQLRSNGSEHQNLRSASVQFAQLIETSIGALGPDVETAVKNL